MFHRTSDFVFNEARLGPILSAAGQLPAAIRYFVTEADRELRGGLVSLGRLTEPWCPVTISRTTENHTLTEYTIKVYYKS